MWLITQKVGELLTLGVTSQGQLNEASVFIPQPVRFISRHMLNKCDINNVHISIHAAYELIDAHGCVVCQDIKMCGISETPCVLRCKRVRYLEHDQHSKSQVECMHQYID